VSATDTPTPQPNPETQQPLAPEAATPETPDAPAPSTPPTEVAPLAEAPVVEEAAEAMAPSQPTGTFCGTGRRKRAVARVRLVPGSGKVLVNDREVTAYFTEIRDRSYVNAPLDITGKAGMWDALINVTGGGPSGQAGAVRLGMARALVASDRTCEPTLRDAGYLTRDARRVERKKYGRRKARRSFQFSKR